MPEIMKDRLADDIETLRADVLKAGVLNAKALQESAELHVARLHDTAEATPALQDASFQVVTSVIAFARLLYGQAAIAESERARREALAAIDRLAAVLGHASCDTRSALTA
ncbi:hypothetical protein [Bosea sp. BH3]|uniref:hypothetical protein n=1 Tax=Bosea sp. BH3 TaxID=2871701 RepID=UPI0021CB1BC8|nr:hypothetical protein [Bosea sp. BH3]MCU4182076.1 hypothetical protein [Bosea sp. BH3]